MPKLQLTDLAVQKLGPGLYFDTKTPAFGLRVGANRKTWLVVKGERRAKVRLGHYPAMTLSEARKRALVVLGSPLAERPTISFPEALEAFLALPRWRPGSKRVLQSSLRNFSWKRNVDKISQEDVIEALEAIKAPSARAHALKDIRTFFNWCVPRYLAVSPAAGIKMEKQPTRDRVLSSDEVKAVWKASHAIPHFGEIIRLLILTGQRKGEIAALQPHWIKDDLVTIPAAIAKNGREHTFPIGSMSKAILDGYTIQPPQNWGWYKAQLDTLSAVKGWTIHDLRRTFASMHAEIGTPIHVIEKMLNHVSGQLSGVAGIYNRYSYQKEMRDAVQKYEAHLQSLLSAEKVDP